MNRQTVVARPRGAIPPGRATLARPGKVAMTFTAVVTNAGTAPTSPTVDVAGPTTGSGFYVSNLTAGATLRVNYAVGAGQTLSIDFATRIATVAGVAVAGIIDVANSTWWSLAPGANTIVASVAATISHRAAF